MNKNKKRFFPFLISVLTVFLITLSVVFATGQQGSSENPLVTLDYLNHVTMPMLMKEVDNKVEEKAAILKSESEANSSACFSCLNLKVGEKVEISSGSQVLVLDGILHSSDPLSDETLGVVSASGSIAANHLCLILKDETELTAESSVRCMVQGMYKLL